MEFHKVLYLDLERRGEETEQLAWLDDVINVEGISLASNLSEDLGVT